MKNILKVLFFVLVVFSLVLIVARLWGGLLLGFLGLEERAGIKIEANTTSNVVIDGKNMGSTPFSYDKLSPGYVFVELMGDPSAGGGQGLYWSGRVPLVEGSVTVVNREMASSVASSSGEVISLERGLGAVVTSFPDGALVIVDGKEVGRSPLSVDISSGDHVFEISKIGFLSRSIRVNIPKGKRLLMNVDLSLQQ